MITQEDVTRYEQMLHGCQTKLEASDPNHTAELLMYKIYLREFLIMQKANQTSIDWLMGASADDFDTFVKQNQPYSDYLRMCENYEMLSGRAGKYLDSNCNFNWPQLACTAWWFANNPSDLQAASNGDFSFTDKTMNCPARLSSEKGPASAATSNTGAYIAYGIAGVAVVGLLAILLRGGK